MTSTLVRPVERKSQCTETSVIAEWILDIKKDTAHSTYFIHSMVLDGRKKITDFSIDSDVSCHH